MNNFNKTFKFNNVSAFENNIIMRRKREEIEKYSKSI